MNADTADISALGLVASRSGGRLAWRGAGASKTIALDVVGRPLLVPAELAPEGEPVAPIPMAAAADGRWIVCPLRGEDGLHCTSGGGDGGVTATRVIPGLLGGVSVAPADDGWFLAATLRTADERLRLYLERYDAALEETGDSAPLNSAGEPLVEHPLLLRLRSGDLATVNPQPNEEGCVQRVAGRVRDTQAWADRVNRHIVDIAGLPADERRCVRPPLAGAALTGGGFVLVWREETLATGAVRLYRQSFGDDLVPLLAGPVLLVAQEAPVNAAPAVATEGNAALAVWTSTRIDAEGRSRYVFPVLRFEPRFEDTAAAPGIVLDGPPLDGTAQAPPVAAALLDTGFLTVAHQPADGDIALRLFGVACGYEPEQVYEDVSEPGEDEREVCTGRAWLRFREE